MHQAILSTGGDDQWLPHPSRWAIKIGDSREPLSWDNEPRRKGSVRRGTDSARTTGYLPKRLVIAPVVVEKEGCDG